jgi:hypothetical protein
LNVDDTSELFRIQKELNREQSKNETPKNENENLQGGPDEEALLKIKSLLNPKLKLLIEKKEAFVPEELDSLMERLLPYLIDAGIAVTEVINIHYGKKIRMKVNFREAEINLFYGKKGYSVVQSPRKGTNDELNELCAELINQFLLQ